MEHKLYLVFHPMVRFPKVLLGLFLAVGLTIASCNDSNPLDGAESPSVEVPTEETVDTIASDIPDETLEEETPVVVGQPNGADVKSDNASDMVAVSIYVMDDSCNNFQTESVEVPIGQAMTKAVGEVLERHRFEAFKLSGYRVNFEGSKAIVDLRLADDSDRQFLSLSSCEQQGLFGGLEETLMKNQTWKVNQVEFTNRGQEIVL